jgi:heme exporter protein A
MFGAAVRDHLGNGGMALIATHIDLGLVDAQVFDVTPFIASVDVPMGSSDEAFL